jgi:hypothetical protein
MKSAWLNRRKCTVFNKDCDILKLAYVLGSLHLKGESGAILPSVVTCEDEFSFFLWQFERHNFVN